MNKYVDYVHSLLIPNKSLLKQTEYQVNLSVYEIEQIGKKWKAFFQVTDTIILLNQHSSFLKALLWLCYLPKIANANVHSGSHFPIFVIFDHDRIFSDNSIESLHFILT